MIVSIKERKKQAEKTTLNLHLQTQTNSCFYEKDLEGQNKT